MKKIFKFASLILAAAALVAVSCTQEELSTDQYENEEVILQAYGPQPVVRGGELRFIGSHLEKVVSVTIPENNVIEDITVVSSGKHSEIRVTVPKETSAPGYPVLTLADGTTLTGKTQLSYSEPISITMVNPASAFPGEKITITGEYLNLIHEVVFEKDVIVSEDAFSKHTRYEIELTVPATARTGALTLGTVDQSKEPGEDLLKTLNLIVYENEFNVGTASGQVRPATVKAGATFSIEGAHLDLVKSVKLEGVTVTEFSGNASKISFTLPAEAKDGEVFMVMESGVEVSAGDLTTVAPSNLSVAPAPVKNGAAITISGNDLDLVAAVNLPNADGVEFALAGGSITLTVPEKAREGAISLVMVNGKSATVNYTLVKPTVTGFSVNPAAAGSPVTVSGTDLDLVAAVTFGGGIKVDLPGDATATEFTVTVPTTAQSGKFVLNLKNGVDLETIDLNIDKPAGAYLVSVPEDVFAPGDILIAEIANEEHLQKVLFDEIEVNYLVNAGKLYVGVPQGVKADTQLHLVSDNGEVVYSLNIDPGTEVTTVLWTGSEDMGSWSNQPYVAPWGYFLENEWAVGDVIRFYITGYADWWQIQLIDGNWGPAIATANPENTVDGVYEMFLTQELVDKLNSLQNWGGLFVVQGENCILTKITFTHFIPQEVVIWEGNEDMGSWSNQPYVAPWGYLADNNVQPGAIIRFYITGYADWWQIQLIDGNWGPAIATANPENTVDGVYEMVLTQEIIDTLNSIQNWGGLFVVQGESCILTKITIEM